MSSPIRLRHFTGDDADAVEKINVASFRGLEYPSRMRMGIGAFLPEGSFIAERDGMITGCVGVIRLDQEDWYEIRNLASNRAEPTNAIEQLVAKAVEYTRSQHARLVKAFTPAVQPYVDAYKRAGFEPVRRSIRIRWDLPRRVGTRAHDMVATRQLSPGDAEDGADVWLAGLKPYWDWWIEEQGGPEEVRDWAREAIVKNPDWWIGAFSDGKMIGIAMLRADSYEPGEARFNGAYVLPEHRGKGAGMSLMNAILERAVEKGQNVMRVYTLAYLDHLAPGAVLYLKSGGRIESEYLQLQLRH